MVMVNEGLQTATGYFHSIPLDIIVLVVGSVALTFVAYRFGKRTALALLLALYPALALFGAFPFMWTGQSALQSAYASAGLFATLWVASFLLTRPFFISSYPTRHLTQFIEAISLGIITMGTAVAIGYRIALLPALYTFAPAIAKVFAGDLVFFSWILLPFIGILLFVRV